MTEWYKQEVHDYPERFLTLLEEAMQASGDLESFQQWVHESLKELGLSTTEFRMDKSDITQQPAYRETLETAPATLNAGTNVIGKLSTDANGESTLLYGHADKSPTAYRLSRSVPLYRSDGDQLIGPGIADDISGITAALSAIQLLQESDFEPRGDVIVGSILGKQLGVLGTYGLVQKFGPTDNAVYVHPAESDKGLGHLKVGSNGVLEFTLRVYGKSPATNEPAHTLFADSGVHPVDKMRLILDELYEWADEASDRYSYPPLEELTNRSVGILVGTVTAGLDGSATTMPSRCTVNGNVCFPPNVSIETIKSEFLDKLDRVFDSDEWLAETTPDLRWGDYIAESCSTPGDSPFVTETIGTIRDVTGTRPSLYYGHTSSDIRYPLLHWESDTFGVGPRSGRMGNSDEWIDRNEYLDTIAIVGHLISKQPTA